MSQTSGQSAVPLVDFAEDELSLDDLDRVVGGLNTEGDLHLFSEGEGGEGNHPPPVVNPPANLPSPLQHIEDQVTSHAITGEQAISQIAALIGSQPNAEMQHIAGAEIATLIGRGFIDATSAMADLRDAVSLNHSLTGTQAAGILAGVVFTQYMSSVLDYDITDAALAETRTLIGANALTVDQAMASYATLMGQEEILVGPLLTEMKNLYQDYNRTPEQLVTAVTSAIDHDVSATFAIGMLSSIVSVIPGPNTSALIETVGHSIADLATQYHIDPAEAMDTLASYIQVGNPRIPALLLAAVEANPLLAHAAGIELAEQLARDPFSTTTVMNNFKAAVAGFDISSNDTIGVLLGVADGGKAAWAAETTVQIVLSGEFGIPAVMTAIQHGVSSSAEADAAVALMYSLATSGYASAYAPSVEATLVAMIENHQITAAQAANDLIGYNGTSRSVEMMMAIATADTPDADAAVATALTTLVGTVGASSLVQTMAMLVGGNGSSLPDNPEINAAVFEQISALIAAGMLTPDDAISALANGAVQTLRGSGREAISDAIVDIAAHAVPPLDAAQVIADVMTVRPAADSGNTILLLAYLAGHNHALATAAGAALVGMIDPNDWMVSRPSFVVGSVTNWVGSLSTLSMDSAMALLSAAVGSGNTAITADIAGAGLSWLVTDRNIPPLTITDAIHGSAVSGLTTGALALVMLANFAAQAGPTAQVAINNEIRALVTGTTPLLPRGQAIDILTDLRDAAQTANNTAFVAILNSELAVLASGDPSTAIFNGLNPTTSFADLESAASQLAALIASGESTAASIMASIDQAYTNDTLTAPQAAQLLINIASHGSAATQTAAGAEFAKIVADAGLGIFVSSSQPSQLSAAILACLGVGLGGKADAVSPTVTHAMDADAALTFVIGALGASTTTEPVRSALWLAAQVLLNGNWSGVPILFQQAPLAMSGTVAASISDIAASHAMSGAELIRAVFVMTGLPQFNAPQQLQSLIGNAQVSMTDVHAAIVAGWWQVDNAIQVLAGQSSTLAVMTELQSLISGGTVTAAAFVNSLHLGLLAGPNAAAVSAENYVRVMSTLAASSSAAVQTAVVDELATAFHNSQLSAAHLAAILAAAGGNQSAMVDQVLVAYDGFAFGALVNAGRVTLDHALVALAQAGELYDGVSHAVIASTYDAELLTAGLVQMIAHGDLSAAAAQSVGLQLAEQGNLALATMAGAVFAAMVAHGDVSASEIIEVVRLDANRYAHVLQGSVGIGIVQMDYLLKSFIAHADPAAALAAVDLARVFANPVSGFFGSPDAAFPFVIAAAANSNASTLPQLASMLKGMIENMIVSFATVTDALDGLPATTALGLYLNMAKTSVYGGLLHDALGEISAMVPGRISASAAVLALNSMLSNAAGSLDAPTYAVLSQAVGAEINAISAANPGTDVLSGIADAIRSGTMTGTQAAQLLLGMITGATVQADVASTISALIAQNLMTAQQLTQSVLAVGQATSQPASEMLAIYIRSPPSILP